MKSFGIIRYILIAILLVMVSSRGEEICLTKGKIVLQSTSACYHQMVAVEVEAEKEFATPHHDWKYPNSNLQFPYCEADKFHRIVSSISPHITDFFLSNLRDLPPPSILV